MIVDAVERTVLDDGRVKLSAQVRWSGGDDELSIALPERDAGEEVDASPFVALCLLPAMVAHEDLTIDGPVSARLLARVDLLSTIYQAWDGRLRPPRVHAAETPVRVSSSPRGVGCFFSRGVDSMFAAVVDRAEPGPVDGLIHCRWLAGRMSDWNAQLDRAGAIRAAALIGAPLVGVDVRAQHFAGQFLPWTDAHGAVLAAVALAAGGGFHSVVVPGTDSFDSLVPYGSHPLTDHLYSTEAVQVVHDDFLLSRADKVGVLADQRPDLLAHLVVCYAEDRVDNCGRCGKCLITMAALRAAGALDAACGFPDEIDLDVVRSLGMSPVQSRLHWVAVLRALPAEGPEADLRGAIEDALLSSARPRASERLGHWVAWVRGGRGSSHSSWRDRERGFDWLHQARMIKVLDEGRPEPPLSATPRSLPNVRLRPHSPS